MRIIGLGTAAAGLLVMTVAATAQTPAAIVEDASGSTPGVEFMDYVPQGKVIKLGSAGKLVLGYLKSCWRETISGGTVTIGAEQSDVQGGTAERAKVACEAAQDAAHRRTRQQERRRRLPPRPGPERQAASAIHALRPLSAGRGEEGHDHRDRARRPAVGRALRDRRRHVRGAFYDFAQDNKALQPSGIYSATVGQVQVLFQIDAQAAPGKAPMAGRLLRLQPAS